MPFKQTVLLLLSLVYLVWSPNLSAAEYWTYNSSCSTGHPLASAFYPSRSAVIDSHTALCSSTGHSYLQSTYTVIGGLDNGEIHRYESCQGFLSGSSDTCPYGDPVLPASLAIAIQYQYVCNDGYTFNQTAVSCVEINAPEVCQSIEGNVFQDELYQTDFPALERPDDWTGCANGCVWSWNAERSGLEQHIDGEEINWYEHNVWTYTGGSCDTPPETWTPPADGDTPAGCPEGSSSISSDQGTLCIDSETGETVSETSDTSQPSIDPANPDDRLSDTVPVSDSPTIDPVTSADVQDVADGIGDDLTNISTGSTESNLESFLDDITGYIWDASPSSTCPLLSYSFAGYTPTEQWTDICGWLVFARYLMDMMFGILTVFAIFYMFDKSAWMRRA